MNTESNREPGPEETAEPWHKVALQLVGSKEDARPVITCECALWGSPCPHSLWPEERATTTDAN